MLKRIHYFRESLSKSEKKVADAILAAPQTAIHSNIATLAKIASVSQPTVNRFCRRLNTKGFPDFKLALAQSLANGTPYVNRHVDENDATDAFTYKIFDSAIASLNMAKNSIDIATINQAVDLLTVAKKISFFGYGASSVVAHDAMNKFFRFNIPVIYFDDTVMQLMSCMNSHQGDVVVLISHSGRTKSLVELAEIARQNGANVIAITSQGTPLTKAADLSILLDVPEDTDIYMPMVSRLAQLIVIDVLATGFTLRSSSTLRDNLKRVKYALKESRFDKSQT